MREPARLRSEYQHVYSFEESLNFRYMAFSVFHGPDQQLQILFDEDYGKIDENLRFLENILIRGETDEITPQKNDSKGLDDFLTRIKVQLMALEMGIMFFSEEQRRDVSLLEQRYKALIDLVQRKTKIRQ